MRRIGSALALLASLAASSPALAVEFYQSVDRNEVGTEDTFVLTVVVSNAPEGSELRLPAADGFEVLSKSQSTQMSYSFGAGGGNMQRVLTHTLILRANRAGPLTIPPSTLATPDGTLQTDALTVKVRNGTFQPDTPQRRSRPGTPQSAQPPPGFGQMPDPFAGLLQGLAGLDDLQQDPPQDDGAAETDDATIPRGDSDLFVRASLSRDEVFVGEQVNYTLHIYSRLDLSSVDSVVMPKLEGFWSEDLDTPSQLSAETKLVNGVPYRVFLLRRRALFPVTAGSLTIEPAAADITTGFLFQGRRVQRKSQELTLKVKPLPPGAPPGMGPGNVGQWHLSSQATEGQVELGQPVTVRLVLEGRGNLKNVTVPPLQGPAELKIYDPTVTDTPAPKGKMGGRRVLEYLVLPSNTGTFTLPSVAFSYFDPDARRYETSRTPPVTFTVVPGSGAPVARPGAAPALPADAGPRNVLSAGGLRPPRASAALSPSAPPLHRSGWFWPALAAPLLLLGGVLAVAAFAGRSRTVDASALRKQQARAARKRLAQAEKLAAESGERFYAEVERALWAFLESKLGEPVQGLTRGPLKDKLKAAGTPDDRVEAVLSALDACEMGRFAPGAASGSREQLLDQAESAMEGWS